MSKFYLRVEGVNLANFIFDTTDLNTIRGGGLLLLDAIGKIEDRFEQLNAISTGASSGLFSFVATNSEKAKTVQNQVADFLNDDPKLMHATFVIDTLPAGKIFNEDKEKLLALNRWQQMQSLTLVVPDNNQQDTEHPLCAIDHVRPSSATRKVKKGDDELIVVSESVFQRRNYGRKDFYKRQGLKNLPCFISDLTELSNEKKRGKLNGKIAVIYLDGNGFGKIQQKVCQSNNAKDALQLFDERIKDYRLGFLRTFLLETIGQPEWTYLDPTDKSEPEKHRLEILLWGGDEILLVVPAWLGWWTLEYFFRKSKDWEFPDLNSDDDKVYPLTHAAGLVFCHHNAPIHRITKQLGDLAKKRSRESSYVAYQVLESSYYAGEDLEEFRNRRCGESGLTSNDLIISGNKMDQVLYAMELIKRAIPKGKVYTIVQALLKKNASSEADKLIGAAEMQLSATVAISQEFEKLRRCFGEGATFWLHLIELWDYIEL
jgi:hypothetical protein